MSDVQKKRRTRRRILHLALGGIILCAIVYGAVWLLFRSPLLSIHAVRFEGSRHVTEGEIQELINHAMAQGRGWMQVFPMRRMFAWPNRLTESDLAFLPRVKEVVIEKHYLSRSIVVHIIERVPVGIWCLKGTMPPVGATESDPSLMAQCYWFDDEGVLFERAPQAEGSLIPVVADYADDKLALREMILPQPFIAPMQSIIKVLAASNVFVKEIRVEDLGLEEVKVATFDGPELYFSLRFPADKALSVIQSLFTQGNTSSSMPLKNLKYIDFRVENRAYYK